MKRGFNTFGIMAVSSIVVSIFLVLFFSTSTFIRPKMQDTKSTILQRESEMPHTNKESDITEDVVSDINTQQEEIHLIPGVFVDSKDTHLGIQDLQFGMETECLYVVDDAELRTLAGLGIRSLKTADALQGSVIEKSSWYTAISEIGNWYSCGKKLTLNFEEGDETSIDYEALTNAGWNRQVHQDLKIGKYIVPLTMMVSGGANGNTDIFMRTSTGTTPTVQFLAVNLRSSLLYEEDGVRTCPCRDEYTVFLSEPYPYENLLPLVENSTNKISE